MVNLTGSLFGEPKILQLDQPTTG